MADFFDQPCIICWDWNRSDTRCRLRKLFDIIDDFTISIPKEITEEDVQGTYYLAALLCGGECTGTWSELEFELPLDESLQKGLLEADDSGFTMSYVSKISIALYGKNFELPTIKNFDFAIYDNLDRLKEKAKVLDIGDSIKIKLIPGNKENAVWRERINHKEKV